MIAARLDPAEEFSAMAAAAAQLTMLRLWVRGEVACPVAKLADRMIACRKLLEPNP